MRPWVLLLVPLISAAQPPLVRGVVLERDSEAGSGEFSVRAPDNQVYRYRFDGKTYVEREDRLIDIPRLYPGEKVEVVSDQLPGSKWRYARTVHVLEDPAPRPPAARRPRPASGFAERSVLAGNLTFSGVVQRLNAERLVLHTRAGDELILLRQDTRYLENGEVVEAATLRPNMRVFVRAARDLWGQVEAYQVIWGKILDPK
jgi:hypothetical protein